MKKDELDLSCFLAKSPEAKIRSKPSTYSDKTSQSELLGLTTKPSSDTGKALKPEAKETISYLVPDWRKRKLLHNLKERTLLRIYLSKWFYQGLDYEERELLLLLLETQGIEHSLLLEKVMKETKRLSQERELGSEDIQGKPVVKNSYSIESQPVLAINLVGASVVANMVLQRETTLNLKGIVALENDELLTLVYSERDFLAVWKLRSFQSLRDKLFSKFDKAKQTGKTGIHKPRIRGYTDGRGNSNDTRRVKMAREADAWFWNNQNQNNWNSMFQELERLGLPVHWLDPP